MNDDQSEVIMSPEFLTEITGGDLSTQHPISRLNDLFLLFDKLPEE